MQKGKLYLALILLLCNLLVHAQPFSLPLQHYYLQEINQNLDNKSDFNHTTVKPFINGFHQIDSALIDDYYRSKKNKDNPWLRRKLFDESLLVVDTGDFFLAIDPAFNFSFTKDFNDNSLRADTTNFINNTRGFFIRGSIGKKLSFSSSFFENQTYFPNYLDTFVNANSIVPGQGRVKPFKQTGFDYAFANSNLVYAISDNYFLELANGKQFYGDGYRSILLSDNAFNFPYLRFGGLFFKKRVSYNLTYSAQQSLVRLPLVNTPEAIFFRKNSVVHFINFIVHPKVHIGLFEAGMWRTQNYNQLRPSSAAYYNPVFLASPLLFKNDSVNNFYHGLNVKILPFKDFVIYSQASFSLSNKKSGYQAGFKYYDVFGLKNLYIQLETNRIETNFYESQGVVNNPNRFNFTHFNQSMSHPYLDGFQDIVFVLNYSYKKIFFQSRSISAKFFERNNPNIINFSGNFQNPKQLLSFDNSIGYTINKKNNTQISVGYLLRNKEFSNFSVDNKLFYLNLQTNLFNKYYDF
jgi:hypothetical protein